MKIKKELIVLVVVIVVLSAYLINYKKDNTHYSLPEITKISQKQAVGLEIKYHGEVIKLHKKGEQWYSDEKDYLMDKYKIDEMLKVISNLKITDLVSEKSAGLNQDNSDQSNYKRYELADDNSILIKISGDDKKSFEFKIGKSAQSYNHTFIKLSGNPNIYLAQENFREEFEISLEELRDKTVLSFIAKSIQEVTVKKENKEVTVIREVVKPESLNSASTSVTDNSSNKSNKKTPAEPLFVWKDLDKKEVENSSIDKLVSVLSNLKCIKYIPIKNKEESNNALYTIDLKADKNKVFKIFIFKDNKKTDEEQGNYWAISSENGSPFILDESVMDSIIKDIKLICLF